jgi:hypothetical protein
VVAPRALVAAACCLFACEPSCGGAGARVPRGSATVVHTGPKQDCTQAFNPVACDGFHQFSVVDVRRDGERVGVLVLQEGAQLVDLFLSDDGGRTFRHVGTGGSLIYQYSWDAHAINLLLRGGRVWVLLGTAESSGSQNSSGRAMFAEWDLETGTLGPLGVGSEGGAFMLPGPAEVSADGTVAVTQNWFDPGPGTSHSLLWRWNLSTFTFGQNHTICSHPACFNTFWRARDDAKEWQAFGVFPDNPANQTQGEACRFLNRWRGDPTLNPYGEYHCVPYSGWTSGDASGTERFAQVFGEDGLLYAVSTKAGRSVARTISRASVLDPAVLASPIDLGPGEHVHAEGFNGRSKWRDLQLVRRKNPAGAEATLVRLANGGPVEVNVPPWPCDGPCAHFDTFYQQSYGSLVWLEPLGDGEWLAFWIIDLEGEGTHQEQLLVERVRETISPLRLDGPVADAGVDPGVSPIPAYPGAAAPTGLIKACALVQQCGLGELNSCITSYGSNMIVGHGSRDRARALLIAAAAGGCASLRDFWPKADCLASNCEANGFDCTQGFCSGFAAIDAGFCDGRAVSWYCDGNRRVACDSAGGETLAADCDVLGEVCTGGPAATCVLPGCSTTPICDGELFSSCQAHMHCADRGQRCDPQYGCVARADIPTDARCRWGVDQPFCAGEYWMFCMGDQLYYLSCPEAGFSACAPFQTGVGPARCTP